MPIVNLSAYTIRLKDKSKGTFVPVASFDGKNDLFDVMDDFLRAVKKKANHNAAAKNVLSVAEFHKDLEGRYLTGISESGQYGLETKIREVKSGDIVHKRTISQADMLPFYFLFNIPAEGDEGLLVLQRTGQYGIRKLIGAALREYVDQKYPSIHISINPLIPEDVIRNKLEKGHVTKLRFIRYGMFKDISDAFDKHDHKEEEGYMQLVVSARRGQSLPLAGRVKDFLSGKRQLQSIIEIQDFPYDTVKVEVRVDGRTRTVDLGDLGKARAYYDVDAQVKKGANGHPVFSSIDGVAKELLEDIKKQMFMGGE